MSFDPLMAAVESLKSAGQFEQATALLERAHVETSFAAPTSPAAPAGAAAPAAPTGEQILGFPVFVDDKGRKYLSHRSLSSMRRDQVTEFRTKYGEEYEASLRNLTKSERGPIYQPGDPTPR